MVIEGKQLATDAAVYPMRLCKAILQGCRRQLQEDDLMVLGIVGIQSKAEDVSEEKLKKRIHTVARHSVRGGADGRAGPGGDPLP